MRSGHTSNERSVNTQEPGAVRRHDKWNEQDGGQTHRIERSGENSQGRAATRGRNQVQSRRARAHSAHADTRPAVPSKHREGATPEAPAQSQGASTDTPPHTQTSDGKRCSYGLCTRNKAPVREGRFAWERPPEAVRLSNLGRIAGWWELCEGREARSSWRIGRARRRHEADGGPRRRKALSPASLRGEVGGGRHRQKLAAARGARVTSNERQHRHSKHGVAPSAHLSPCAGRTGEGHRRTERAKNCQALPHLLPRSTPSSRERDARSRRPSDLLLRLSSPPVASVFLLVVAADILLYAAAFPHHPHDHPHDEPEPVDVDGQQEHEQSDEREGGAYMVLQPATYSPQQTAHLHSRLPPPSCQAHHLHESVEPPLVARGRAAERARPPGVEDQARDEERQNKEGETHVSTAVHVQVVHELGRVEKHIRRVVQHLHTGGTEGKAQLARDDEADADTAARLREGKQRYGDDVVQEHLREVLLGGIHEDQAHRPHDVPRRLLQVGGLHLEAPGVVARHWPGHERRARGVPPLTRPLAKPRLARQAQAQAKIQRRAVEEELPHRRVPLVHHSLTAAPLQAP
eukprot:scaffold1465_cov383-Prasinococcus_capsulatus_cf.AAC.7